MSHSEPVVNRPDARHIERFPLGTTYPAVVKRVKALMAEPHLRGAPRVDEWKMVGISGNIIGSSKRTTPGGPALVVDATGVGRPVVDMLIAEKLDPIAVTITGGDAVAYDRGWKVPKRDLVGVMAVLLQTGRFAVSNALPLAPVLMQELLAFRVKIDVLTAHDSYGAWREGAHDDIVLACAVACWYAERQAARPSSTIPPSTSQFVMP